MSVITGSTVTAVHTSVRPGNWAPPSPVPGPVYHPLGVYTTVGSDGAIVAVESILIRSADRSSTLTFTPEVFVDAVTASILRGCPPKKDVNETDIDRSDNIIKESGMGKNLRGIFSGRKSDNRDESRVFQCFISRA